MAVCLCAGLAVGLLWRYGYVALKVEPLRQYHETTQHVVGTVVEEATDYRDFSQRLVVDTLGSRALLYLKPVPELAELRAGDIIEVECKLRVPLPGETDDVLATKRSKGIFLVGVQDGALSVERRESVYWTHQLKRWSVSLRDKLMATLPQPVSSLATGVFFGYKAGFSPTQEEQIRVNGLAHVVSVSGMHIAFLMGFLLLIFGNRRWAFVPALLVLLLFVALVGFPASAMRAYIMQAMLLLAYVRGRPNDTLTALAVALAVLLLFNPFAVADVGLQLSFAATLGIALFAARWQAGLTRLLCKPTLVAPQLPVARLPRMATATWRRLRRYIIGGLATSMAALVLSTPLIVYYFGTLSLLDRVTARLNLSAVDGWEVQAPD